MLKLKRLLKLSLVSAIILITTSSCQFTKYVAHKQQCPPRPKLPAIKPIELENVSAHTYEKMLKRRGMLKTYILRLEALCER